MDSNPTATTAPEMLQRARDGDSVAQNAVFLRYVNRLHNLARCRLENKLNAKFDADDVVQSVFRSFFRRNAAGQFVVEDWQDLWCLLARITIRKCGRRTVKYNRDKRDVRRETSLRGHSFGEYQWDAVSAEPTPAEVAALEDVLSKLMSSLNEQQRELVSLKLQGYTNEEVSQLIGRAERTVYRVLRDVRECLEGVESELI